MIDSEILGGISTTRRHSDVITRTCAVILALSLPCIVLVFTPLRGEWWVEAIRWTLFGAALTLIPWVWTNVRIQKRVQARVDELVEEYRAAQQNGAE